MHGDLILGKHIAQNTAINDEIFALIRGLDKDSRALILRQIARSFDVFLAKNPKITTFTNAEAVEFSDICANFFSNILKLSENLYVYKDYFLPINHFEISVFWHKHGLCRLESQTLQTMQQKDFIDVGGFIADSAIIFEREFCDKTIYTFEPTSLNFTLMKETIRLNNATRIVPLNFGLGASEENAQISIASSGSSIAFNYGGESESVKIRTLDSFVESRKIEVGFIKVDIEGFEMEFLKGAKRTICAQKPAMLISIYHQPSDYFQIKPLIESWNLGYSFKIFKGVDFHASFETVLLCEVIN